MQLLSIRQENTFGHIHTNYNPPVYRNTTKKTLYNRMNRIHLYESGSGSSYILILFFGVNELTVNIHLVTIDIIIQ